MGALFAPLGTRITVCSFTPSRMGIITSRLTYSKPSLVGSNFCGVSLGKVLTWPWTTGNPANVNTSVEINILAAKEFFPLIEHSSYRLFSFRDGNEELQFLRPFIISI